MIGKFTLKQGGNTILEQENLITTLGKKAMLDFVAGYNKQLVGSIGVGVGSTAANVADRRLALEVTRVSVVATYADYVNNAVVFKGTIPQEVAMTIYEMGSFTMDAQVAASGSQMITSFDPALEPWSGGSFVATNSRIDTALQLTSPVSTATTYSLPNLFLDLSAYSPTDRFTLAYRANNAFIASFAVRLVTSTGNYYQTTVSAPTSGSYTITSINKSAFTATGTPDWSNITQVDIVVTSTAGGVGSIDFDAIRVDDTDAIREENIMFSRTVLGSTVVKTADLPMDIEYSVTLT